MMKHATTLASAAVRPWRALMPPFPESEPHMTTIRTLSPRPLLLVGLAMCLLLPAAARAQDDPAQAVLVLQAEVAMLKRENDKMLVRLARLESQMLATGTMIRAVEQRVEISGNRQTAEIVLRPGAGADRVGEVPGGVQIGRRETVVRAGQILLVGDEIVLSGRRSIRLDAPDISILGVRTPVVKGSGDVSVKGTKTGTN